MRLVRFFVERSFYVHLITAAIVISGVVSLLALKRDLQPPFRWNHIKITATIPGASPQEVEKFVTFPVEDVLDGIPGTTRMTSFSTLGLSQIDLYFAADFDDMTDALDTVNTRIASIESRLPDSMQEIRSEIIKETEFFLIWMGLENFDETNEAHRAFYKSLEESLLEVPGVANTNTDFRVRNIHVKLDPIRLKHHEVSVEEVREVLLAGLSMSPVGAVKVDYRETMVTLERVAKDIAGIAELPLRANLAGYALKIKDVADVKWELADKDAIYYVNGQPGFTFSLTKSVEADAIDLKHDVWSVVAEKQKVAPEGVKIVNMVDGPQFIERQMRVLNQNGLIGLGLVFLLLMFFLNFKTALMATLGLPIAYFGTFSILLIMGIDIDLISLVGLILVIGILVDDAIIVAEKYSDLLASGMKPTEAATKTVSELLVPVSGTVMTTMVAFAPVLLIKSEIGKVIYAIPVIVLSALALSWFESFFILPNHLAHLVKDPNPKKDLFFGRVKRRYEQLLLWGLRYRYLLMVIGASMIGGASWLASTKLKHNFSFSIFAERISIHAELQESSSHQYTEEAIQPIIEFLESQKGLEVENTFAGIGYDWVDGQSRQGPKYARILAYLDRNHPYPSELKEDLKNKLDPFLKKFKKEAGFSKLYAEIQRSNADEEVNQMVSLFVSGGEDSDFSSVIDEMITRTKDSKTFLPFEPDENRWQDQWEFRPDTAKMAQHRMNPMSLSRQMRSLFGNDEVIETRFGGENVKVFTEIGDSQSLSFDALKSLLVLNNAGASVPLEFLGEWRQKRALVRIDHKEGKRSLDLRVKVNQETGNMNTAQRELTSLAEDFSKLFPAFTFKAEASNEQEKSSSAWALKVSVVCILGVLFVIAFTLGSVTQPLVVGLPIPFGLVGIVMALYVHDEPLGMMALIGLVSTVGVAVNASIVMVDQINKRAKEAGEMSKKVIVDGASSRLRAIILTTVTTVGGVFPMAYGIGGESGFTQPLAFAMGWGLTFATIMTVFLVPSYLQIREDIRIFISRLMARRQLTTIPAEVPAVATFDPSGTTFANDSAAVAAQGKGDLEGLIDFQDEFNGKCEQPSHHPDLGSNTRPEVEL